ncbi:MAG: bifunctional 3-phosphoshikimate 1-carboxyvinyltransferase/cytidylate kinase [Rhodocyclaceae bacterium]|nr:bifunctional 3-phosphoshikimate 1-carboxyvinyltransferase/cytidylate kinase [Rhodocyclaceae bacterium]
MSVFFDIPPLIRASGEVRLPGSKSISNRTLLLAAIAEGATEVHDLLDADDTRIMLAALARLGVSVTQLGGHSWRIEGCGGAFPVKEAELFLGNAGTAFRPLTAVLALSGGRYRLRGVARMHERPIGDLVEGLRQLGCDIRYLEREGYPPLEIRPASLQVATPIRLRGDVSSQFLTALLMALPLLSESAQIELATELISKPYVEITLKLMARFGVTVERDDWRRFLLPAGQRYRSPGLIHVEGDASSASYFLAAGALGGGPVRVVGVGSHSIQGDVAFAKILADLGAQIEWEEHAIVARAPATGKLRAFDLDLNAIPDAAMTLAILALFADGPSVLRNIASWRVKETDRIAAMAKELAKIGAKVEEGADWLAVSPPTTFVSHAAIATYDDHRMAMCFALVAFAGVPIRILDPACVGKTFPGFFDALARIAAPVIALDGPSASGKGTVAARLARALGFHLLDSGALYRLVALAALEAGVSLEDEAGLAALAAALPARFDGERVFLAEKEVSVEIRREEIGRAASQIAAYPKVREALLERQRDFRRFPGLVADGRDMGSVVFPDAAVKVFLTASPRARAERRYNQLIEKGIPANMLPPLTVLAQELAERDRRDAERQVAPLKRCEDAELLDTTELGIEEAVAAAMAIVQRRLPFINPPPVA